MSKVKTGLFNSAAEAAAAVETLLARDVPLEQISVIASKSVDKEDFAVETKSKIAEGAAIGAGTGGGIAAVVAGFAAVGTVTSGGLGLIATGPLVAALAGAGAGAAAGSALGGLIGFAIPEHEVKFYKDAIDQGSVLVGVNTDEVDDDVVEDTFEEFNVSKVSSA